MLHKSAVKPELLRVLGQLMHIEAFSGLRLVGGTALALYIGHRESVDIDLFGKIDFEDQEENIDYKRDHLSLPRFFIMFW